MQPILESPAQPVPVQPVAAHSIPPSPVAYHNRSSTKQWLVGLLITEVVMVLAATGILSIYFRFPDILREPAGVVLPLFAANQALIVPAYYLFTLSALLFLPLSVLFRRLFSGIVSRTRVDLLVGLGVATALLQSIGFSRWLFAVPYLSQAYTGAVGNEPAQVSIGVIYDLLNTYAGMTIGEHLGFLAMGSWTIVLALMLPKTGRFSHWLAGAGVLTGILMVISVGEHFGTELSGVFGGLNFMANALWSVWTLVLAGRIGMRDTNNNRLR